MLNISINPVTELRKTYTYCPQNNTQEKTQKQCNARDMEGKERVEMWGVFMPQSTAPSHHQHWFPPISSLNARIYGVSFFHFIEVSFNRDIDWIFGQWWLISTPVPSLLPTHEGVSNLEFHYWLCQPILLVHEISWYLWKTKIPKFSGVLDHEPGKGSNMHNKMIIKHGQVKGPGYSDHFFPIALINFHNREIIITWHILILSGPKQVGSEIISNEHIHRKITKIGHECE